MFFFSPICAFVRVSRPGDDGVGGKSRRKLSRISRLTSSVSRPLTGLMISGEGGGKANINFTTKLGAAGLAFKYPHHAQSLIPKKWESMENEEGRQTGGDSV